MFDINIIEGKEYGTIYSEIYEDTADEFESTPIEFKFIAKDSIDIDSAVIKLKVVTYLQGDGGGACSILPGTKGVKVPEQLSISPKILSEKNPSQIISNYKTVKNLSKSINFQMEGAKNINSVSSLTEGEIFGIAKVMIRKNREIHHFEITIIPDTLAEKDTIAFTEKAQLIIQAKDSAGNSIEFNNDTLLTFKVETNESYGTFINKNGDTLKTTPVDIKDITYGDANKGLIKFAAVKENPDSMVKCLIKVVLQDDTTKIGKREAVVLEQTFFIVIEAPLEVEPIITSRRNDSDSRDYMTNTTEENIKNFGVKLTRGGKLVRNHGFRLTTNYLNGSGGHDHLEYRRPDNTERLRLQNYGRFYSYQTDSTHNPLIERTSSDTILNRFNYIASLWGDTMKIYLESQCNPLLKDSVNIVERIILNRLAANQNYTLIGGTDQHHGPPGYNVDHNHYGIINVIQNITQIGTDWHSAFRNEQLLNINDMSLPYGGKFDINGTWTGDHATHRRGEDVDIKTELPGSRPGIPVRIPRNASDWSNTTLVRNRDFERICSNHGGTAAIHSPNTRREHYHIDF